MVPITVARPRTRHLCARMHIVSHHYAQPLMTYTCCYLVNSVDDFCLFAPPKPGKGSAIGDSEVGLSFFSHKYMSSSFDPAHRSLLVHEGRLWYSPDSRRIHSRCPFRPNSGFRSDHRYVFSLYLSGSALNQSSFVRYREFNEPQHSQR